MSLVPKIEEFIWQPDASNERLRQRAQIIKSIRDFFYARDVLEVETPLLCHTSVTDPFIESIPALVQTHHGAKEQRYYLQTSPEYAMKRLLANNIGPIFQICKAFRQEQIGRSHNPEFTMIEWYRPGFDHHALMDEMDELLQLVLKSKKARRLSYAEIFQIYLNINPHQTNTAELKQIANHHQLNIAAEIDDIDTYLQLLSSEIIEKEIAKDTVPTFIYDFPITQAALAKIIPGNPPVAARFEVYFRGLELANGFYELQNAQEQRIRFEKNLKHREALGLNKLPIDELFLSALAHGLPDCAGVALGIDRLIMLALDCKAISEVLSFSFSRS